MGEFTIEDLARITNSVGAMALFILTKAKNEEDRMEAYELHKLHGKLISVLANATSDNKSN